MKSVVKTTWEIGTPWELRTATSVPRSIHYKEMNLGNKTTSEFRTVFDSPLQWVSLISGFHCTYLFACFLSFSGSDVRFSSLFLHRLLPGCRLANTPNRVTEVHGTKGPDYRDDTYIGYCPCEGALLCNSIGLSVVPIGPVGKRIQIGQSWFTPTFLWE